MEQFIKIIDTYFFNYHLYELGKVEFDCHYGELIFFKGNPNMLTLFGIYILVESVMSKILYEYLLRFRYKNRKFKRMYDGFMYKIKN